MCWLDNPVNAADEVAIGATPAALLLLLAPAARENDEAKVQSAANAPGGARGLPFQIRGGMQTILALRLLAPQDPSFFPLLVDKIAHSPDFFREAPLLLDLGAVTELPPVDLSGFIERLRQSRLIPVGVQNGSAAWNEAATALGLAVFGAGGAASLPERPAAPPRRPMRDAAVPREAAAVQPDVARGPAMLIDGPIRGGQQVLAGDGDLVVTAQVGHGAEIAAAGHIHVYAALRGRAFAGINGDETAMIFCDQLEAQLLSIAGVHIVAEELDPKLVGKRVRVRLDQDRLVVQLAG